MKQDQLLFSSLFAVFFGFLIFILSIMNQGLRLIAIFTTYYVLFLLLGLVIMLTGFVFMLIWHVSNRQPFEDKENKRESFYGYLALGIFSLTMGFLYMLCFHFRKHRGNSPAGKRPEKFLY